MSREIENFEKAVSDYLDGVLPTDQMDEFVETLSTNSEKLDNLVDRAVIEAELCRYGEMAATMDNSGRERVWGGRARIDWVKSVAVAAAVILLGVVLLDRITVPPPEAFADLRLSPHALASVSGLDNGEHDGSLSEGTIVRVTQGSAEILMSEGVKCLLQSPGSIRLVAKGEVRLMEGAARFTVEEQAQGFRVMTDELEIIDLGTDFGVDLSIKDQPQVHVIEGKVEVRSLSGRRERSTLTGGHAVALGAAGMLLSTPLDPKRFPGELPAGIPAVHFSFDQDEKGVSSATGALAKKSNAKLMLDHAKAPDIGAGRFGKGIHFNRTPAYALSNWKGIGGTMGRTISLWMKSDVEKPMMLLGWGKKQNAELMSSFGLRLGRGKNPGALRIESGRRWLQAETDLTDGKWHHVVVCMGQYSRNDWPETKLFVDGREEALTPRMPEDNRAAPLDTFFTDIHSPGSTPLVIGQMSEPGSLWPLPSYEGFMDEIIIAQGVLNAEQAKALYDGRLEDSGLDLE